MPVDNAERSQDAGGYPADMAIDSMDQLLQLLREHPQWREQLRSVLLTDQLLALPERTAELAKAQVETQHQLGQLAARVDDLAQRVDDLTQRLDQLLKRLDVMAGRLDEALGSLVELRYQRRPWAYFSPIALRLREMAGPEIDDLLEPAVTDGRLTLEEAAHVRSADSLASGRLRSTGAEGVLVVEASVVIDRQDVERALDRAALLRRLGVDAVAVVAGDVVSDHTERLALTRGAWVVTNGRTLNPAA